MSDAERQSPGSWGRRYGPIAAYVAAWILLSLVGVGVVLLLRGALLRLGAVAGVGAWQFQLFDQSAFVVLALLFIIAAGILEGYLRSGAQKRQLRARILRVLLIEALLAGAAYGVRLLLSVT